MQKYTLKFVGDVLRKPKFIEFEADDPAKALEIAHYEAPDRSAELWSGGKKLCTIRRDPVGTEEFWEVSR